MAIIARRKADGIEKTFLVAASTTVTKDTFVTFSSGYITPATSATTQLKVIAQETVTSGAGQNLPCKCIVIDERVELEMDTTANTSQALVGTKVDLTDAATVNGAATTTKVVFVSGLVGATTNKKITGYIVSKDA